MRVRDLFRPLIVISMFVFVMTIDSSPRSASVQAAPANITVSLTDEQVDALDYTLGGSSRTVWAQSVVDVEIRPMIQRRKDSKRDEAAQSLPDDDRFRASALAIAKAMKDGTVTCAQAETLVGRSLPCSTPAGRGSIK